MAGHPSLLNMPDDAYAVVCEVGGCLSQGIPAQLQHILAKYPDSNCKMSSEMMRPAAKKGELAAAAFLPRDCKEGGLLARLASTWWEEGIQGLLQASKSPFLRQLLGLLRLPLSLQASLHPHLKLSTSEMVERYSGARAWAAEPVRALAWHPHTPKLAIALKDDTVKIFPAPDSPSQVQPLLKAACMRLISCLSWRPLSAGYLAVGCAGGLVIWTIDPSSCSSRASSNNHQEGPRTAISAKMIQAS